MQILTVRDENGVEQTLKVTEEHPFYRESDGWTLARKLDTGDIILGADGTLTVVSNEAEQHPGGVTVYNLEVEQAHTYFVLADDATDAGAVWVHNANYTRSEVAGRRVYQSDDLFDLGTPSKVNKRIDPSIRARIAAGETNLDLMRSGNAPIGRDGQYVNLHHLLGEEPGPMAEVLGSLNRSKRPLHGLIARNHSFRNTPGLEAQYAAFRQEYWKQRAQGILRSTFTDGSGI